MTENLSFDEFSAIRLRERSQREQKTMKSTAKNDNPQVDEVNTKSKFPKTKTETEEKAPPEKSFLASMGDFIEMHETQFFCIFLLILDSYIAYLLIIINSVSLELQNDNVKRILTTIIPLIKSFTAFTQIYFIVELAVIFFSFGLSVLGHLGYTVDFFVVASQFYFDLVVYGRESRILNLFRMWRIYRLLISMVNEEKESHARSKDLLEETEVNMKKLEIEFNNIQEDLIREKEARSSVEDMLQDYKEEVDTLNEALKIAARDIAEVAEAEEDLFQSDEEGEGDGENDDASEYTRGTNVSKASSGVTFVVHSDGSFVQR